MKPLWNKEEFLVTWRLPPLSSFPVMFPNPLPNDNILDLSTFKAFPDDKISVTYEQKLILGWVENVGKGKNAGYQHFLLSPQYFQKASSSWSLEVRIVW